MTMSTTPDPRPTPGAAGDIHARLALVLAEVEAISKDRVNEAQRFKFRGVDDVYNALHGIFARHGIYVRPEVVEARQTDRQTAKGGTQIHAVVKMRYHFTAGDGSSVAMEMIGEAADSGDKSLGKAAQYAYKVLLLQAFLIPTEGDNDPDGHGVEWGSGARSGQRRPEAQPEKPEKPEKPATKDAGEMVLSALRGAREYTAAKTILDKSRMSKNPEIVARRAEIDSVAAEVLAALFAKLPHKDRQDLLEPMT